MMSKKQKEMIDKIPGDWIASRKMEDTYPGCSWDTEGYFFIIDPSISSAGLPQKYFYISYPGILYLNGEHEIKVHMQRPIEVNNYIKIQLRYSNFK